MFDKVESEIKPNSADLVFTTVFEKNFSCVKKSATQNWELQTTHSTRLYSVWFIIQ